jgi:hypothetical protein
MRRAALGAILIGVVGLALGAAPAAAVTAPRSAGPLGAKAFYQPEFVIGNGHVPLDALRAELPNGPAWDAFFARHGSQFSVYVDPRSGAAAGVAGRIPLLPGRGDGNTLTLADVSARLGRSVERVDAAVVADVVRGFLEDNAAALGIDAGQLGAVRATAAGDDTWQIHVPQQVDGVPVRHARLAATVKYGNLVLVGSETWGGVSVRTRPALDAEAALEAGFAYAGGRSLSDVIWREPELEIVPFAPAEHERGAGFAGPVGAGYGHRLAWVFGFRRQPDVESWQVTLDAHTGEVLAFEDLNQYADVTGGAYPTTNTDVCTLLPSGLIDYEKCGLMQPRQPMPWADTGLPAPDDFTNGHGVFNWLGGGATTTLTGRYLRISDVCGAINEPGAFGSIDLGGVTGQHDCTVPAGHSAGDTSSSRSCFYETNKLADMARGWLPGNVWLTTQVPANVNINASCNAFYSPGAGSVNFYRSSAQCRNTGEIAAVFDHEWGHAMDDNDANGVLSNSSEAYADIAAIYRLQASCVGYGFFKATGAPACGFTPDGTGNNGNEAQVGAPHCDLDCSGVRDADWARHAGGVPDTPQNFVCPSCQASSGPCGRQVHCAAAPSRQAAWDLAARDLRAAPFLFDANTAFILANRLFYLGAGNVGLWHACNCAAGTSDGCGATNAYMNWITADDDDGNLANGTPHMTAIYAAFNRHNIACPTPTPQNGGCPYRLPKPDVSVASGVDYVTLSWPAVANAARYHVLRSEGFTGCHLGKTLIATVPAGPNPLVYNDKGLLEGRRYCYTVMAVGSSDACLSAASTCTCVTTGNCAPGYSLLREDFGGGIPASGWTVVDGGVGGGTAATWTDADPCGHQPPAPFAAPSPMVDTKCAGTFPPPLVQDEQLISPRVDAGNCKRVFLDFDNYYIWDQGGVADVDVSIDGGVSWTNVYRMEVHDGYPTPNHKSLDITTPAALQPSVQVRFHYLNQFIWSIDNVRITCGC